MKKIKIAIIMLIILLASTAYGATYYINGASGNDSDPGTIGSPWKTLSKANTTLQAGDTVYIRGGEYTVGTTGSADDGINPSNSGSSGSPITYQSYPSEQVTFTGDNNVEWSRAVYIKDKSYIRVIGHETYKMKFTNTRYMLQILGSDHCEVAYCDFDTVRTDLYVQYTAGACREQSSHNWIHHNNFEDIGRFVETQAHPRIVAHQGIGLEVGTDRNNPSYGDPYDNSDYNTVEYNTFFGGGHHCLGVHSRYNIIRHNNIQNAPWYDMGGGELVGYRPMMLNGQDDYSGHNLLEDNRIHHGLANPSEGQPGGSNLSLCSAYNIIRYNDFYTSDGCQIYFHPYKEIYFRSKPIYNHVYNNTFFDGGKGTDSDLGTKAWRYAIKFELYDGTDEEAYSWAIGNVFKNNLFDSNYNQVTLQENSIVRDYYPGGGFGEAPLHQTIENNQDDYISPFINPLFVNADTSDPTSSTSPNLSLKSGSPMIDQGIYLTQAIDPGSNSTTLIVDDARYFHDGTWGSSLASIDADWIVIGTVSNVVQISSINYDTNTITLASTMTWADGDRVWLFKKSDGITVLRGIGPDIGAHESPISPPKNLRIVQ